MTDRTKILLSFALFALIFLCSDFYYSLKIDDLGPEQKEDFINFRRRRGFGRCRYCNGRGFGRCRYCRRRPMCSGSGCSFYDKYGYYRNLNDYYDHNQYRFQYPSYPLIYSEYPNYFVY
jgi:hypothetical protein